MHIDFWFEIYVIWFVDVKSIRKKKRITTAIIVAEKQQKIKQKPSEGRRKKIRRNAPKTKLKYDSKTTIIHNMNITCSYYAFIIVFCRHKTTKKKWLFRSRILVSLDICFAFHFFSLFSFLSLSLSLSVFLFFTIAEIRPFGSILTLTLYCKHRKYYIRNVPTNTRTPYKLF